MIALYLHIGPNEFSWFRFHALLIEFIVFMLKPNRICMTPLPMSVPLTHAIKTIPISSKTLNDGK